MAERNPSHQLNQFGSIDYRKPLGKQPDMRTSTYLGHKLMDDTMLGNRTQIKCEETKSYEEDPLLEKHRTTDYRANYVWKFGNPEEIRNYSIKGNIHYMKPFYECKLKFLKRPILPANSITHSDYIWQPKMSTSCPKRGHIPTAVFSKKIIVDRNKSGYAKYLDPAATTTRIDYCYRSPQDILNSIAAKDNITFWNWKDIKYENKNVFRVRNAQLCDQLPSKNCIKRRGEFPSKVKAVPNSGLTTEIRENYIKPNERANIFDDQKIKNYSTFVASEPEMKSTEYGALCSGEPTLKHV